MGAYKAERDRILRAFGENLRELRPLGVSQEAVGETARLHRTEIGNLERGRSEPSLHTLLILGAAYGVSLDELVSGVPVPVERKPSPYATRGPARTPTSRQPAKGKPANTKQPKAQSKASRPQARPEAQPQANPPETNRPKVSPPKPNSPKASRPQARPKARPQAHPQVNPPRANQSKASH